LKLKGDSQALGYFQVSVQAFCVVQMDVDHSPQSTQLLSTNEALVNQMTTKVLIDLLSEIREQTSRKRILPAFHACSAAVQLFVAHKQHNN